MLAIMILFLVSNSTWHKIGTEKNKSNCEKKAYTYKFSFLNPYVPVNHETLKKIKEKVLRFACIVHLVQKHLLRENYARL